VCIPCAFTGIDDLGGADSVLGSGFNDPLDRRRMHAVPAPLELQISPAGVKQPAALAATLHPICMPTQYQVLMFGHRPVWRNKGRQKSRITNTTLPFLPLYHAATD
jgi:hypothetical protein